jgi:hypothetical protein
MADALSPWPHPVRLGEIGRKLGLRLEADEAARVRIAKALELPRLLRLSAELTLEPWLDGARLDGRFAGEVEYECGVTLEPFEAPVAGEIEVKLLPVGSPNAPEPETAEVAIDPDAPEAPDIFEGDVIDVGAYLVEHLALELDPFPRKPGASFEAPPDESNVSPFAALKDWKGGASRG